MRRDRPAVRVGGLPRRGDVRDDLPPVSADLGGEFIAGEKELGMVRPPERRVQVGRMVTDDQQRPAVPDGSGQPGEEGAPERPRQVYVLGCHQIVGALWRCPLDQVLALPANARGHLAAGLGGVFGAPAERHAGDVHRRDLPASVRKPDGVGALSGARVQGRPRREAAEPAHLGNQMTVGVTAPQRVRGTVPGVPELGGKRLGSVLVPAHRNPP